MAAPFNGMPRLELRTASAKYGMYWPAKLSPVIYAYNITAQLLSVQTKQCGNYTHVHVLVFREDLVEVSQELYKMSRSLG